MALCQSRVAAASGVHISAKPSLLPRPSLHRVSVACFGNEAAFSVTLPRCARLMRGDRIVASVGRGIMAPVAPLAPDSYVCLGLAHCFEKSSDGRLVERMVIEPISASSLECMATGARTSFKLATGTTAKVAMTRDRSSLPTEFADAVFCEKFDYRCEAAARTWLRSHAQDNLMDIVPLGKVRGKFNFSLDDKRVLNLENEVTDEDNIKQDLSIDVYGRKEKEDAAKATAAAAAAAVEMKQASEEAVEDELDALLA